MDGRLCTFLLVLCVGAAADGWLDGDDGVDRPNGDLPNMPITNMSCSTAASACAALCADSSRCVAWAFRKPNCSSRVNPLCYLKGELMKQSYNSDIVSGGGGVHLYFSSTAADFESYKLHIPCSRQIFLIFTADALAY